MNQNDDTWVMEDILLFYFICAFENIKLPLNHGDLKESLTEMQNVWILSKMAPGRI